MICQSRKRTGNIVGPSGDGLTIIQVFPKLAFDRPGGGYMTAVTNCREASTGHSDQMRANRPVSSKLLIKQYLASSVVADQRPAIFCVKPCGARTRSGTEIGDRIAGISQCLTGH